MKTSFSVAATNTTDATFRAWGAALSDAMEAVGFVKTADTGQVDWAAVVKPVLSTFAGYEIRQLSDSMQSTVPIFAKIEYGAGSTQTYPKLRIQLGRGTDGAGNLTGMVSAQFIPGCADVSATAYDCFVSGGEGYIAVALWTTANSNFPIMFYIARTRDADGTINNKGVNFVSQASYYFAQQWLPASGVALPTTPMTGPFCTGPKVGTGSYGTVVGVYPIFAYMGYAGHPDGVGIAYFPVDMSGGGAVSTISMFGANHDFVAGGASSAGFINGNTGVSSMLLRWE